jgi:hypothetical protein
MADIRVERIAAHPVDDEPGGDEEEQARQLASAVIGLAGPYAFDPTTWPTTKEIFARAISDPGKARPVAFVRADAPPALLLCGLADETVGPFNAQEHAAVYSQTGNQVQRADYPAIGHSGLVLALAWPLRWRALVLDNITAFVDRLGDERNTRTFKFGAVVSVTAE